MTVVLGILWLAAIAVSGHALSGSLGVMGGLAARLWHVGAAVLLGLGASSAGFGVVAMTTGVRPGALAAKDLLLLFIAVWWMRRHRGDVRVGRAAPAGPALRWWWLLGGMVCVSVFAWSAYFRALPDVDWDAWMIWNLRARFLAHAPHDLARAFAPSLAFSHTDYPLLVPGLVTTAWLFVGTEALWAPAVVSNVIALACVCVVSGAVARLRGDVAGALAGVTLLGAPFYVGQAAAQCADVPVSAFVVLSASLLVRPVGGQLGEARDRLAVAIAGTAAALAAWTKNEGSLFFLAGCLALLFTSRAEPPAEVGGTAIWTRLRRLACFAGGASPVLLLLVWFKWSLPVQNDLVAASSLESVVSRVTDFERHVRIAGAMAVEPFTVGKWNGLPVVLAAAAVWLRLGGRRTGARLPGVWFATVLTGFFAVYVLTPQGLEWHLVTSLDRLYVQLWPLMVLAAFVAMGEADQRASPPDGVG